MKKTRVISAFPACGKTFACEYFKNKVILDSDSSQFSWVYTDNNEKIRNPDFPDNYISHIKYNIGTADYILVSSHQNVREALKAANIKFMLVYPNKKLLHEWVGRCYLRKNNGFSIDLLVEKWDEWIAQCKEESEENGIFSYELSSGEYLSDVINVLDITRRKFK